MSSTVRTFAPVITDKKYSLRAAVYDAFRKRSPLITKKQAQMQIARQFNISVPTVQRYIRKMENGSMFALPEGRQGRHVYAWSDEALSFFTNFFLAAIKEVGGCTVRNAYNCTKAEAQRQGWQMSPLKNLIVFFSKDKNQIEKFPLSDFFSRLQSTLGISAFIFSYFRS